MILYLYYALMVLKYGLDCIGVDVTRIPILISWVYLGYFLIWLLGQKEWPREIEILINLPVDWLPFGSQFTWYACWGQVGVCVLYYAYKHFRQVLVLALVLLLIGGPSG